MKADAKPAWSSGLLAFAQGDDIVEGPAALREVRFGSGALATL